jgi:hypothetical protein
MSEHETYLGDGLFASWDGLASETPGAARGWRS